MEDISFLKNRVRDAVQSDVVDVAAFHAARNDVVPYGGCFGIPRQVFCIVDFLGAVAYDNNQQKGEGGASTAKAVRFVKDFFPDTYKSYAPLMVAMWRHGTVHNFQPYVYYAVENDKRIMVKWTSNNGAEPHNRAVNPHLFRIENGNSVCMSVNICSLADDLLAALDRLIAKMEEKPTFGCACLVRLNRLLEPVDSMEIPRLGYEARKRIRDQVLLASGITLGKIEGDQIEWD